MMEVTEEDITEYLEMVLESEDKIPPVVLATAKFYASKGALPALTSVLLHELKEARMRIAKLAQELEEVKESIDFRKNFIN